MCVYVLYESNSGCCSSVVSVVSVADKLAGTVTANALIVPAAAFAASIKDWLLRCA